MQLRRILVPLDGSPEGEAILPQIPRIADTNTEIFLFHALPESDPPSGGVAPGLLALPDQAERYLDAARARIHRGTTKSIVRTGDAVDSILKASRELEVQLIAMTTHARTGISRLLMGSVAEGVVRASEQPVLLARPGLAASEIPLRRILVPVDGSEHSFQILEALRMLRQKDSIEVTLLQVVRLIVVGDPVTGFVSPTMPTHLPDPKPALEERARLLEKDGFRTRTLSSLGDPHTEILRFAREIDADWIAMTTVGRTGLKRLLLGSVAEGVLRHMDRPILLHRVSGESQA
jgi:nucleotide-binding universal stress UspA family protein